MSGNGPAGFFVLLQPSGVLLLRGELDLATVQDLQDAIDEILIPGEPIILDLAQLTFLETSAIHRLEDMAGEIVEWVVEETTVENQK